MPVRRYLPLLLLFVLMAAPRVRALTDEEKRAAFLEARKESDQADVTPSPSPHHHHKKPAASEATPSASPRKRHHPASSATPAPTETPAPEETPVPKETPSSRHHHRAAPTPEETASPKRHREEPSKPEETPKKPSPTPPIINWEDSHPLRTPQPSTPPPAPQPRATPSPTPPPRNSSESQIQIQKEGLEEQGALAPPPPPPAHHHWWQFGYHEAVEYHYLTPAIRNAIDKAPVARRRWRYIVVHNSGTRQGNARIFDYYHRYVRKMPNGLAYHFVIGNGTSSGNGQIEIGNRWTRQINGGHVHSDFLNNISLGICLVGDFNRDLPTKEQLEALDELIRYLRVRVGKIDRQDAIVKAHKEINPVPTDCPGDRFPYHWLHARFG